MIKNIFTAIIIFGSFYCHSQILVSLIFGDKLNSEGVEFGLDGGFNWNNISNLEANAPLRKLNLGMYFDIRLKNQIWLYTGVLVKSNMGQDKLSTNDLSSLGLINPYSDIGSYNQSISYFMVPILARYKFKNRVYVEAGPQLALMSKAFIEYESTVDDSQTIIRTLNTSDVNRIDVGIAIGTGFRLREKNSLTIGIKYYQGFVDVYKDITNTKNSGLFLKVNIPIGVAGKESNDPESSEQLN